MNKAHSQAQARPVPVKPPKLTAKAAAKTTGKLSARSKTVRKAAGGQVGGKPTGAAHAARGKETSAATGTANTLAPLRATEGKPSAAKAEASLTKAPASKAAGRQAPVKKVEAGKHAVTGQAAGSAKAKAPAKPSAAKPAKAGAGAPRKPDAAQGHQAAKAVPAKDVRVKALKAKAAPVAPKREPAPKPKTAPAAETKRAAAQIPKAEPTGAETEALALAAAPAAHRPAAARPKPASAGPQVAVATDVSQADALLAAPTDLPARTTPTPVKAQPAPAASTAPQAGQAGGEGQAKTFRDDPGLDRRIIEGMLDDKDIFLDDMHRKGFGRDAVVRRAAELGLSEALIRQVKGVAADLAGERPGRRPTPSSLGARTCLSCDRVFFSSGPGNRLCTRCRGGDAGLAQL